WYVMTSPPDESGRVSLGLHAFLMGRLNDGEWFLSDQGPSPAREIQALTLPDLEMAIRHAVRTDGYWLFTGAPSSFILGGWTGVKVLAGPGGVEQQAAGLVEAGRFL